MNGIGYGITPFMGSHGILARSSGGGGGGFVNEYSMSFDGVDEYVNCGNDSSLNPSSNISVSLWFKGSNITKLQYLFSKLYYRLSIKPVSGGTQLIWEVYYTSSGLTKITLGTNFADGNWHHILATYQSGATLGQKLYVDGNLLGQINAQSQIYTSGFPFLIGGFITSSLQTFQGNIDEVAVWNTDQSSNVSTIYNGGVPTDLTSLSPVSWWRMGDGDTWNGSTWTLTDNGSGGNDATSVNMEEADRLPISPNSYTQNSFAFDGVDEYLTMGNTLDFTNTDAFSISCWFKRTRSGVSEFLISKQDSTSNSRGYTLLIPFDDNKVTVVIRNNTASSGRLIVDCTTAITDTNWHHIVMTYDGSSNVNGVNLYLDGNNDTGVTSGTLSATISNTASFQVGAKNGASQFSGNIDEVSIFNSELSASDVSTIFNNGVPQDISSLSPISHWRMGENATWNGSTWTLTDQGSGGNNATSVNMEEADKTGDQAYVI